MIREAIAKVVKGADLTEVEMVDVMNEIMGGDATSAQIASFITALRIKGETVSEITGAARVMREKAVRVTAEGKCVVDMCGTGGDEAMTFNISTAAAFVVAGCGIIVAKHGNRSVSSKSGSADVLESLGVNIEAGVAVVEACLREVGIGFMFAPLMHSAMKFAAPVRREIGIRTIFNMLGPLTNPAGAKMQVLGVYAPELTDIFAKVLLNLGSMHAFVVHGSDGLDEITLTGETKVTELKVTELKDGFIRTYHIKPEDFGLKRCAPKDIMGGDPEENARIITDVLNGKKGPERDIVLLNAAAGITVAGKARSLEEGVAIAHGSIDSGEAMKKLKALIAKTNG
ncbi:MAG: anthranilate phosphoribosyltransferase [Deltaproteobacteria bacterium]